MIDFIEFPKIARLNREIVVTEKIDGTNAQVFIRPESDGGFEFGTDTQVALPDGSQGFIRAGSRTRWISTQDDNFGFAQWVHQNRTNSRSSDPAATTASGGGWASSASTV